MHCFGGIYDKTDSLPGSANKYVNRLHFDPLFKVKVQHQLTYNNHVDILEVNTITVDKLNQIIRFYVIFG